MTTLANTIESVNNDCIDSENYEWLYTYRPLYMWFIFILGATENFFVVSVFLLHKSRCTVTEIYLGNMAAADLIFISRLPFWAIYYSNKMYWPFGDFMCGAVGSLFTLNLYSSIYFLMMVSIERYLALVKATSIGRLRRPWWAKVTCGIIWIFTALLSVPSGMFRKVKFREKFNTTGCVTDSPSVSWSIAGNIILNVLGFFVPLVVTAFCTSQMICALRNSTTQKVKKFNKEKKATWLVLSVFFVFIVCWLPYNIHIFINTLDQFKVCLPCTVITLNRIIYQISICLVYSNSCINPVMYTMFGNNFRQKVREIYSWLLCKEPDRWKSWFPTEGSINSTQSSFSMRPYRRKSIA